MDAKRIFEILMRENTAMLMAFLRSTIRDANTVDDLFQGTMLVAWRRLDEFDRERAFGPWLRGIASKLVLAHYRQHAQSAMTLDQSGLEWLESRFANLQNQPGDSYSEKLAALRDCVELLPDDYLWLGSDGQDAWLVPALGPIRVGDETGLGRWLSQREQLSTPYLHVESILARMGRGYRLNEKPATELTLSSGTTVSCQQIEGNLRWRNKDKAPDKVKLWSDAQTGVAMRLELVWNVPTGSLGHHKIAIEFVDSPALADDWFAFAGHSTSNRRVLRFDATD